MTLPKEIQIGGQVLTTQICDELGGKLGKVRVSNGYIKIASNIDGSVQTESSMLNTYIHECTHAILDTMGRGDLSEDEVFVSSFAGFATEGILSILKQYTNYDPTTTHAEAKEALCGKPAWSKMDEDTLESLISLLQDYGSPFEGAVIDWLKSLKARIENYKAIDYD